MSKRRLVDTNLIIRYLLQDHEKHSRTANLLFEACDRGEIVLVILSPVVAECVFVLESFYKYPRQTTAHAIIGLFGSPGIALSDAAIQIDALSRYSASKAHFIDCVIAAHAVSHALPVATFDAGFRKFSDVTVNVE